MSTKLGTLTLDLIAKTGGFEGPIDKARKKVSKDLKRMREDVNTSAEAFAGLAVASTAATAALVADSARDARELQNLSDLANAGVEEFQRYAIAAETVGIEQDKLADILKDTTDRVGDFLETGGGPMADFFENIAPKVGVTADEFRNLSGPEALQLYVDSLDRANLSQEQMTFYLEAVASDATALIPLLRDNGKELQNLEQRAEELGLVLSQTEVDQLAGLGDDFSIATRALDVFVSKVGAQLAPVISQATDEFFGAAEGAVDLNEASVDTFENMVEGAAFAIDAVNGVGRVFDVAANAMVTTFAGALDVLAGGAAKTLEIIDKIPTVRLLVDDSDIQSLRDFQRIQQQVAREGIDSISQSLNEPLAGDRIREWAANAREEMKQVEDQARETGEAEAEGREKAVRLTGEQIKAQEEYLQKLQETQEVINGQQLQGLDGLFEQYLNLAKSDLVSGSRFLDDRIRVLKEIIQDQANAGFNPDSIAVRQSIVAQLEQGQLPTATGQKSDDPLQQVNELATQSLEVTKAIEQNTRTLADIAQQELPNIGTLNLKLADGHGNQIEAQVQANAEQIGNLQQFLNNFVNDEARADGA